MFSADRSTAPGGLAVQAPWDQRLARVLVRPLAGTRITPNQLTAISLLVGLTAGWFFAQGGTAVHWGALLFVLATFMDHADGELARMTGQTSRFGHVFDIIAGGVVHVVLFCGMGYGLRETWLGTWALPMGLVAGVAVALIFILRFEMERRGNKDGGRQPSFAGFEIEDVMYVVGPVTWLGGLAPFLLLASIGAPIFLSYQLWLFRPRGTAGVEKTAPSEPAE